MTDASTTGAVDAPLDKTLVAHNKALIDRNATLVAERDAAIQRAEAAENDALKFYFRCERAAYAFQRGDMKEAERQIMGLPGEDVPAELTARLDAEWNAAIEAGYQACLTCDGALNNAGAAAVKVRALRRAAPTEGEA